MWDVHPSIDRRHLLPSQAGHYSSSRPRLDTEPTATSWSPIPSQTYLSPYPASTPCSNVYPAQVDSALYFPLSRLDWYCFWKWTQSCDACSGVRRDSTLNSWGSDWGWVSGSGQWSLNAFYGTGLVETVCGPLLLIWSKDCDGRPTLTGHNEDSAAVAGDSADLNRW